MFVEYFCTTVIHTGLTIFWKFWKPGNVGEFG